MHINLKKKFNISVPNTQADLPTSKIYYTDSLLTTLAVSGSSLSITEGLDLLVVLNNPDYMHST